MRPVQPHESVVLMRINQTDGGRIPRFGHPVNGVNFQTKDIPFILIPWDRLTLPDIAEEMMFWACRQGFKIQAESG